MRACSLRATSRRVSPRALRNLASLGSVNRRSLHSRRMLFIFVAFSVSYCAGFPDETV